MSQLSDSEIINRLKIRSGDRVLDVGGSAKQHEQIRIDTLVDIVRPEKEPYWPSRLKALHFIKVDLNREKLPFKDKEFDVCLCSHTLEDLYDPFNTIDEMFRVAKRGYLTTPSMGKDMEFSHYDLTEWMTGGRQPGLSHHHWFFRRDHGLVRIVPKSYALLYSDEFRIAKWLGEEEFHFFWKDKIKYKIFNPTRFHSLVEEYRSFMKSNSRYLKRGIILFYFDNPYYFLKERIKYFLKRGMMFQRKIKS